MVYDAELRRTLSDVLNIDFFLVSQLGPRPLCQSVLMVLEFVELLSLHLLPSWPQLLVLILINQILPVQFSGGPYLAVDAAVIQWRIGHNYPPPVLLK